MKFRLRTGLAALLVMFVVGTSESASASAHEWLVNKSPLVGQKNTTLSGYKFSLELKSAGNRVTCDSVTGTGIVQAAGKGEATELKFSGCTTGGGSCEVKSAGSPAKAHEIIITHLATRLVERAKAGSETKVLALEFKGSGVEENFSSLEFGKEETISTNKFKSLGCTGSPSYPGLIELTGQIAAAVINTTEELNFPEQPLSGNKLLTGFGEGVSLKGSLKEALVLGGTLEGK